MNARERFLVLAVGGLFAAIALQYGLGKYNTAKRLRDNQIINLEQQLTVGQERQLRGEEAIRRMGDMQTRSLPSDLEFARSDYGNWLLNMGRAAGLNNLSVDFANQLPDDLYQQIAFKVGGTGELEELVWMLHAFHSKDYLHRIRQVTVRPTNDPRKLSIEMDVEALALTAAQPDLQPPSTPSPSVAASVDEYKHPILNRNFFSPPNRAPEFAGEPSVDAVKGEDFTYVAKFSDPDSDPVVYTLAGDPPDGVEIDDESGQLRWTPASLGSVELTVRATDQGLPAKSSEQKLVINVVDPEPEPDAEPEFDEASQAVLTGLTESRGNKTAWINVRTSGQTVKLHAGDSFDIGSLQGTVVDVTPHDLVLEINDRRFTLRLNDNLAEAAQTSDIQ